MPGIDFKYVDYLYTLDMYASVCMSSVSAQEYDSHKTAMGDFIDTLVGHPLTGSIARASLLDMLIEREAPAAAGLREHAKPRSPKKKGKEQKALVEGGWKDLPAFFPLLVSAQC
jgi:hypothetical protein